MICAKRDPAVAFVYGWVMLLVIQTGGMAAVAGLCPYPD